MPVDLLLIPDQGSNIDLVSKDMVDCRGPEMPSCPSREAVRAKGAGNLLATFTLKGHTKRSLDYRRFLFLWYQGGLLEPPYQDFDPFISERSQVLYLRPVARAAEIRIVSIGTLVQCSKRKSFWSALLLGIIKALADYQPGVHNTTRLYPPADAERHF